VLEVYTKEELGVNGRGRRSMQKALT